MRQWMKVLAVALLVSVSAVAASLGDPAPPLSVAEWVKGGPVEVGPGKGIMVVEFWATWCAPCKESIPHLSELQEQYAGQGVTVIGISAEEATKVHPFVQRMNAEMEYAVGIDDDEQTSKAYMEAFGLDSIPQAFLIDQQGLIVWHGHPMELDEVLAQAVAGTFDWQKQQNTDKAKALLPVFQHLVHTVREPDIALMVGERMLEYGAQDREVLEGVVSITCLSSKGDSSLTALATKAFGMLEERVGAEDWRLCRLGALMAFERGSSDEAVRLQERAVALAEDESSDVQTRLRAELQHYVDSVSFP